MKSPISGPINIQGRVAIVTGASQGIGRASCLALSREGARIAAVDIKSLQSTSEAIKSSGCEVLEIRCDIGDKESVEAVVRQVLEAWGQVDILINNAGIFGTSAAFVEEYKPDDWDVVLQTNLKGTFLMTQAVWPSMRSSRSGKIVCMGSIAARVGGVLAGPHYCASKGGIHSFVKWAAKRGARHGIYVNGIAPGPIETPMIKEQPYRDDMVPLGRLGQPEDIAETVIFLASQASNFITGATIDVNGGMFMN